MTRKGILLLVFCLTSAVSSYATTLTGAIVFATDSNGSYITQGIDPYGTNVWTTQRNNTAGGSELYLLSGS